MNTDFIWYLAGAMWWGTGNGYGGYGYGDGNGYGLGFSTTFGDGPCDGAGDFYCEVITMGDIFFEFISK